MTLSASPVSRLPISEVTGEALELSLRLGAGFYDCVYLAMALGEADVLITADARFVRAAQADLLLASSIMTLDST